MAINQKIPSPEEIKTSPQSFTEQELNQLKELRDNLQKITIQFGQLTVSKIKLEENEVKLKDQLVNLEKQETNLAKSLSNKYGKGSIYLETGTFTPSK